MRSSRFAASGLASILLLVGALSPTGCSTTATAGGTTVTESAGTYETIYNAGTIEVVDAAKAVLEDMNIPITSSAATAVDGEVVARTASDDRISISVKSVTEKSSRLKIRVGTFGDKAVSFNILDRIKAKLGG